MKKQHLLYVPELHTDLSSPPGSHEIMANSRGAALTVTNISKAYQRGQQNTRLWSWLGRNKTAPGLDVLQNVSLTVAAGSFVSLVGPSGCGKSTLLKIMAGLELPDHGAVTLNSDEAVRVGAVGYMPQRDMLLPWRNVLDNATLALEFAGYSRATARTLVHPLLDSFGLTEFAAASPKILSGGMKQRLALLRTILGGQSCLLLDEPFGALDALTRRGLQRWLLDLRAALQRTIVLVTHDVDEAVLLSDRILVLSPRPGRIVSDIAVPAEAASRNDPEDPAFRRTARRVIEALEQSGGIETNSRVRHRRANKDE